MIIDSKMETYLFLISVLCLFSVNCQKQKYELVLRNTVPYSGGRLKFECSVHPSIPTNYRIQWYYTTELKSQWHYMKGVTNRNEDAYGIKSESIIADKPETGLIMTIVCFLYDEHESRITDSEYVTILLTDLKIVSSGVTEVDTKYYKDGEVATLDCVFPVVTPNIEYFLNSLEYEWYHIYDGFAHSVKDGGNCGRIINQGTLRGVRYETKLTVKHDGSKLFCEARKENTVVGNSKEVLLKLDRNSDSRPSFSTIDTSDEYDNIREDDEKTTKIRIRNYTEVLYYDAGNSIDYTCYSERKNVVFNQRLVWFQTMSSNRVRKISEESITEEVNLRLDAAFADNDTSLFCALVSAGSRYDYIDRSDPIRILLNGRHSVSQPTVSVVGSADKCGNTGEDDEKTAKIWIRNYIPMLYYDAGNSIDFSCYSDRKNVKLDQRLAWFQRRASNGFYRISDESVTMEVDLHLNAVFADNDTSLFCALVNAGWTYNSYIATSDPIRIILNEPNLTILAKPKKEMYQVNDAVTFTCKDHNIPPYGTLSWRGKTVNYGVILKENLFSLGNTLKVNVNESHHQMHVTCVVYYATKSRIVSNVFTIIVDDLTLPKVKSNSAVLTASSSINPPKGSVTSGLTTEAPINASSFDIDTDDAGALVKPSNNTTSGLLTKNEPTVDAVISVTPDNSKIPGPLAVNELIDKFLLWLGVGVAVLIVLLIIVAISIYKLQKKPNVTPKVNDNHDTDQEPVYSYAAAPVLSWEDAHARAANNRPLPRYQTFVPNLPPRNVDQAEYAYIDPKNLRR